MKSSTEFDYPSLMEKVKEILIKKKEFEKIRQLYDSYSTYYPKIINKVSGVEFEKHMYNYIIEEAEKLGVKL